jgi:transcriptional regulator with GAF, ATPase, and Fis domain
VPKDRELLRACVELAGAVLEDFDIVEFLHRLTRRASEILDVAEVGILLVNDGALQVLASSTERARNVELFQLHSDEGPCMECFRAGTAVIVEDLDAERERWPRYVPAARAAGFASVHALPLRLHEDRIGVLGLLGTTPARLGESDLFAVQALADIATIAILQQRTVQQTLITKDQLQTALSSRVAIEQAKGILSERYGVPMDDSFNQLRSYSRNHNLRLHEVAQGLINGAITLGASGAPEKPANPEPD